MLDKLGREWSVMFHHLIFSTEINYLVNSVNSPKLCRKLLSGGQGAQLGVGWEGGRVDARGGQTLFN